MYYTFKLKPMNLIYLALAQALEVYVIFFESLKGGIKNSPREVSSTNFPSDLPVHLHFNLVGSLVVLFATRMACQMMTQMIDMVISLVVILLYFKRDRGKRYVLF